MHSDYIGMNESRTKRSSYIVEGSLPHNPQNLEHSREYKKNSNGNSGGGMETCLTVEYPRMHWWRLFWETLLNQLFYKPYLNGSEF